MLKYDKVFSIMEAKNIKQIDLRKNGIHPRTFQKLRESALIRSDVINSLCALLNCQPGDIMEYIPDQPDADPKVTPQADQPQNNP